MDPGLGSMNQTKPGLERLSWCVLRAILTATLSKPQDNSRKRHFVTSSYR